MRELDCKSLQGYLKPRLNKLPEKFKGLCKLLVGSKNG